MRSARISKRLRFGGGLRSAGWTGGRCGGATERRDQNVERSNPNRSWTTVEAGPRVRGRNKPDPDHPAQKPGTERDGQADQERSAASSRLHGSYAPYESRLERRLRWHGYGRFEGTDVGIERAAWR